ncbi:MAG TPA: helix-turn-helix domain-containing protein [Gemmatimonadales bacterium]|jgi:sugar-specific transcriptional regulator TrmB
MALDLTPFGFTPTESLVYEILVTRGPGTGYAVARAAGLARANAYGALEGLVGKGAARVDGGRPKRYRPEPPPLLLARIVDRQGRAVDDLALALSGIALPPSPTLTELTSLRGVSQVLSLEVARARAEVRLFLTAESFPPLMPALRRATALPIRLELYADAPVSQPVVEITVAEPGDRWPGRPLLAAIDDRLALVGAAAGDGVSGFWGTSPPLLAAARLAIGALATKA